MNEIAFENPWALAGMLLTFIPLWRSGARSHSYPWVDILPADPLSQILMLLIRALGAVAVATLVTGLSGIHLKAQSVERIGHGAQIVLLLDRSNSMDTSFAGRTPGGDGQDAGDMSTQGADTEESKSSAARRLLKQFVDQRPHDLIGIAEYSTSPLYVMPLTENRETVHAAIDATASPALAYTNISKGLSMALSFFEQPSGEGSRIILLVSDGAAVVDPDTEARLRQLFEQRQIGLYWLFLRTENSPGIFAEPEDPRDDNAQAMPERYLHRFFTSLKIPYHAYEADNPEAMQKAIEDINNLEQLPLHYRERVPKKDLSGLCYGWAAVSIALLAAVKLAETTT